MSLSLGTDARAGSAAPVQEPTRTGSTDAGASTPEPMPMPPAIPEPDGSAEPSVRELPGPTQPGPATAPEPDPAAGDPPPATASAAEGPGPAMEPPTDAPLSDATADLSDQDDAAPPHPLRSGTRRGFFTFMAGRSWNLRGDPNDQSYYAQQLGIEQSEQQLVLEEAVGFHIKPGGSGFAPSLVFRQQLSKVNPGYTFGARAQWDIALSQRYGVYVTPSILAGYHMAPNAYKSGGYSYYYYYYSSGSGLTSYYHQAIGQIGVGVKLLLVDRLQLTFRPVSLSIRGPTDMGVDIDWDLSGGFGITF